MICKKRVNFAERFTDFIKKNEKFETYELGIFSIMFKTDGYKIRDQGKPHFLTFTVVDWIDVFTRKRYKDILIESLNYCMKYKGMVVYGYVIMSNHMHIIIQSNEGELSGIIRDFKKFTSKKIIKSIKEEPDSRQEWMLERFAIATYSHNRNKTYQFWRYGNHPEEIYSEKFLWSKLDYIHLNPIRAGLLQRASNYVNSSASNYVNGNGLLPISSVANPVVNVLRPNTFW